MQGTDPLAPIVAASGGFPVDGDELWLLWPHCSNPTLAVMFEQGGINGIEQKAQLSACRNAIMDGGKSFQEIRVMLTPGYNLVAVIAGSNCGIGNQNHSLG